MKVFFINSVNLKSNRTFIIYSGVSKENIDPTIDIIDNTVLVINNEIVEEMLVDSGYSGNNFETYILFNNENNIF